MRYLLHAAMFTMLALFVCAGYTHAAADWEWSRDKGWTQGAGKVKDTPGAQLRSGYKREKAGKYMIAAKEYFLLLKTYPDSQEAGIALQRLAACLFQMEDYYDAFNALQQVIKTYPISAKKSDLIKIEFLIARRFQEGARKDLLNDKEPVAVGKQAAIDIFKAVIDNDPVGPYAGAATLAVAACYKDLKNPQEGIVYADRVVNEFGQSVELVAKARILKKQMEVMLGRADVRGVKQEIENATKLLDEAKGSPSSGAGDFASNTDFDEEIRELEEAQAQKMWEAASFYKRRGTRESVSAYKFSLEQLVIRFPNTTYADEARRVVGKVKIPPKQNPFGKLNLPFVHEKKPPSFVVAPNSESHVDTVPVRIPGTPDGEDMPSASGSVAHAKPVAPPQRTVQPELPGTVVRRRTPDASVGTPEIPNENTGIDVDEPVQKPQPVSRVAAKVPAEPVQVAAVRTPAPTHTRPAVHRSTPPGASSTAASPGSLLPASRRKPVYSKPAPAPTRRMAPPVSAISANEETSRSVIVHKSNQVVREPVSRTVSRRPSAPAAPRGASSAVPSSLRPARKPVASSNQPVQATRSVAVPVGRSTPLLPGEEVTGEERVIVSDGAVTVDSSETVTAREPVTSSNLELPPLPEGNSEEVTVIREAASTATSTANDAAAGGNNWKFSEDFE